VNVLDLKFCRHSAVFDRSHS